MSRRATCCNHCRNIGENLQVWSSHNTLDAKGRVCCPKILNNVCNKCNQRGHLSSRCKGEKNEEDSLVETPIKLKPVANIKLSSIKLASKMDWSAESDDECPANVTIRSKLKRNWADDSDEE